MLKASTENSLNNILIECYKSLNSNSDLVSNFWDNFQILSENVDKFETYASERHDAIKLAVTFGLSQTSKTIAWHAATDLKPKFQNYNFEATSLNREVAHILTSMKREIQIALVSKPKEDTEYDEFKIQNKVKQLQEANSLFDKDLSPEEQMKLPNIEIKKPGNKANTNKKNKRKLSNLNDLSCSFELDEPEKAIKLDNDRTHVNNNIFAKKQIKWQ